MMRLLALDASGAGCSAAIWDDGAILASGDEQLWRGHAARLLPLIDGVMQQAMTATGLDWSGLDLIAVTVGPGSFTGIRVGLAAARGLGLALGKPVIGVSSFQVMAEAAWAGAAVQGALSVVIDPRPGARQGPAVLFRQDFDAARQPIGLPASFDAASAPLPPLQWQVAGDRIAEAEIDRARHDLIETGPPQAVHLAALVASGRAATQPPRPLYLKPPDLSLPKARRTADATG